jgi:predicted enzyme related to lactoylglutathione lyase
MRISLILDCADPGKLAEFWTAALGYERLPWENDTYVVLIDPERKRPVLSLQRVPEPKTVKNRMHMDLHTRDMQAEIDRLRALGATQLTEVPLAIENVDWVVMADPEGNEFCIVSP